MEFAVRNFIEKWATGPDRSEMIEDLRRVVIQSQQSFRNDQLKERFVDHTGDAFLKACQKSLAEEIPTPPTQELIPFAEVLGLDKLVGDLRRFILFLQIRGTNEPEFIRYTTYVEITCGWGSSYWLQFTTPDEVIADFAALTRLLEMEDMQ